LVWVLSASIPLLRENFPGRTSIRSYCLRMQFFNAALFQPQNPATSPRQRHIMSHNNRRQVMILMQLLDQPKS
jgi:hypothetical protein